jgi:methanogenic corrinoid protein MtbC1
MEASEILRQLGDSVIAYDAQAALAWAQRAVAEKLDPVVALAALTDAIRRVGEGFECGELWLPDLIAAAESMSVATAILEGEIERSGARQRSAGVVVIGTVFGDIHDIGKNMVATLFRAGGFEVHDLGVNITAKGFVDAVTRYDAQILAMSALLSTTAPEQRKVIDALLAEGLRDRVRVMVGGGGLTREFGAAIGADGYEATAPGAVRLARGWLAK